MGSNSSRPLFELQRSARVTDGKVRLPQLTEQAYLRGDDVVAEFKYWNVMCWKLAIQYKPPDYTHKIP